MDLKIPDFMAGITTIIKTPGSKVSQIWPEGGKMLLCAAGSLASAIAVGFLASRIAASFARIMRKELFAKVDSFSMEEISHFSIHSLITRTTNDVTQVRMYITLSLQLMAKAPIMGIWAISKITNKGFEWSLATGITLLAMLLIIAITMVFVMPKFKVMQILTDNLTAVTRENLTGLRVIKAFNAGDYHNKKFEKANEALTYNHLYTSRAMALMMPTMMAMMSILSLAIYWIGAFLINKTSLGSDRLVIFSNMSVFFSYAIQLIMSFMLLVMIFVMLPRAFVSAKRINEVLDTQAQIKDGPLSESGSPLEKQGELVFKNVSFKYPGADEYVLSDISFSSHRGQTTAFIGSTGSGKSTLVNLITRFYDVTEGEVLLEGVNVKDYELMALYDKIGYVSQKAVVFRGSVKDNVAFGESKDRDFSAENLKEAVRIAQAEEFVENMEDTYNSAISQSGTNISGGQKQRLAIARAIYKKPQFYIFDDSFSALDYKTDRILRNELKNHTRHATTFIVASRIGTIMDADQIIVLDEGKIVGKGKHRELLDNCEVYREIAASQLTKEELEA